MPLDLDTNGDEPAAFHRRVSLALSRNPYLSNRKLRFEASEGRVTLKGKVRTYFQKQMAQEMLRDVEGVASIENDLEVIWA